MIHEALLNNFFLYALGGSKLYHIHFVESNVYTGCYKRENIFPEQKSTLKKISELANILWLYGR